MADDPGYISLFATLNSLLHDGRSDWLLHPEWIDVFLALTPAEMVALYGTSSGGTVTHLLGPLTAHQLILGNGADDVKALGSVGATLQVLTGVTGADPAWSASPALTGLTVDSPTLFVDAVNHGVGIGTTSLVGTVKLAVLGTIKLESGPDASGIFLTTAAGINRWLMRVGNAEGGANSGSDYTISARDDSGASLFPNIFKIVRSSGNVVIDGTNNTFTVDSTNHRVGVGTLTPSQGFHAVGGNATGFLIDNNGSQYTEVDFAHGGTIRGSWYWDETNSLFNFGLGSGTYKWVFSNGTIDIGAFISKYNNIATVNGGVPAEYATVDTTGLTANVAASTLYAVPANGEGMYRISAYVVETIAGSVSSVLPNVQIIYTDKDSNVAVTIDATPILGAAGLGQTGALNANAGGTVSSGVIVIYVKASTTIQYQTSNYASVAAGMTYALRIRLELL
jgi:hypothetical protein